MNDKVNLYISMVYKILFCIWAGQKGSQNIKHEFIVTHHSMPTKSEQFKKMKEFEHHIINKKDAEERKTLPGSKEIARIERKLKKVGQWISFPIQIWTPYGKNYSILFNSIHY